MEGVAARPARVEGGPVPRSAPTSGASHRVRRRLRAPQHHAYFHHHDRKNTTRPAGHRSSLSHPAKLSSVSKLCVSQVAPDA